METAVRQEETGGEGEAVQQRQAGRKREDVDINEDDDAYVAVEEDEIVVVAEDDQQQRDAAAAAAAAAEEEEEEKAAADAAAEGEGLDDAALDRMMGEKVRFEPEVEEFLRLLYDEVYDRNLEAIRRLYEVDYPSLSERFYPDKRWPPVEEVATFYRQYDRYHCLIITLYRELYYRHLFLKCQQEVTWEDRRFAWDNYTLLIKFLAEVECRPDEQKDGKSLRLPLQWLWDLLDEFVYQFQEACRWRQRVARRLPEDERERAAFIKEMDKDSDVWKASQVLEHLHALVERSEIQDWLRQQQQLLLLPSSAAGGGGGLGGYAAAAGGGGAAAAGGGGGGGLLPAATAAALLKDAEAARAKLFETEIRYQLGYFAMILLLRLHVLMGDYFMGVKSVQYFDLSPRSPYWKVPAAHLTLFYHLGFSYMMMRRYLDAVRVMSQLLIFVSRQRSYLSTHTYQQATMNKAVDRMYVLVMLCASLCNVKLDEGLMQTIREKYTDKYYKLQQENEDTYYELFTWSCPKFINPAMPAFEDPQALEQFSNSYAEVQLRQCKIFLKEVEYHRKISTISSFAKLYNNIQLSKLAALMETTDKDPEDAVRSEILCVKHKSRQKVWRSGSLLSGDMVTTISENNVEFYMEQDMIHVRNQQAQKVYIDQFLKQIERSQNLIQQVQAISNGGRPPQQGRDTTRAGPGGMQEKSFDRRPYGEREDRRGVGDQAPRQQAQAVF